MQTVLTNGRKRANAKYCSLVLVACSAAGCASIDSSFAPQRPFASAESAACAAWFTQLDAAIERAGVRDAGTYRIPGFRYLRVDRFAASFGDEVKDNPPAFDAWALRLQALDAAARAYELKNLPAQFLQALNVRDKNEAAVQSGVCRSRLAGEQLRLAAQRELLIARAQVPHDYVQWKRALGLYPLTRIPFRAGVDAWERQVEVKFSNAAAGAPGAGQLTRYHAAAPAPPAARVAAMFARLSTDALGIPQLERDDRETLFQAYAPAFEIETAAGYDRIGSLAWGGDPAPQVDSADPVVYRRLAYTRYRGKTLLQLVFTIWFSERPRESGLDLLAGALDGVILRITLDAAGRPLVYDTIHPCGCYHLFFPSARVRPLPPPEAGIEWAFIPATLPAQDAGARVVLRIESGTHYVVGLRPDGGSGGDLAYRFAEDDDLRALPAADGATRSAYGADGIIPGTERAERYFYWPMGVHNSGAMRQWGRHATAFVGRRHFDDADLIERRFELLPAEKAAARAVQP